MINAYNAVIQIPRGKYLDNNAKVFSKKVHFHRLDNISNCQNDDPVLEIIQHVDLLGDNWQSQILTCKHDFYGHFQMNEHLYLYREAPEASFKDKCCPLGKGKQDQRLIFKVKLWKSR